MTADMLRGVIPEFVDAETEQIFRRCCVSETVYQARAALWVAVIAALSFALNDIRQAGFELESVMQFGLCFASIMWSAWLLLRLRRPIEAPALQCLLLAWAIVIDVLAIAEGVASPSNLLVMQTVLFGLVTFLPLRFVASAINGACFAVGLIAILRWRCAAMSPLLYPLSIAMGFALAIGLQQVWRAERMRRQEFARVRSETHQREALRRAKDVAEAADRAKTTLLAVVSHEVRIPMNGVLGVLQLLEDSRLDAIQRRQVAIARDCAEHLTGLLDSMIDYVRLGAVVEEPVPTDFDPRQLIQGVVELMRTRALARQTTIDVLVNRDVPEALHADAGRLRQVLVNLLSNAVKFTERGRVGVLLTMRGGVAGELQLEITVEDTGIGIPENMLARIFDEFTQADESIGRRFGGAGLGLAVCRRVVDMLGGTITAVSEHGVGSRFQVVVPVAAAIVAAPPDIPASPPSRRLKLLVVDDDPINQVVICGLLTQAGHDATPVSSGEAAVAETAREHFDGVFLDLHMPLVDGIETARRIRAQNARAQERREMPIVVLTADLLRAQSAGVTDIFTSVLVKPIRRDALRRVLETVGGTAVARPRPSDKIWSTDAAVDLVCLSEHAEALGAAAVGWLVHQFRHEGRRLLNDLGEAVAEQNASRIKALSHRLTSSAAALGLVRLGRLAERVKQAAGRDEASELFALLIALGIEFEHTFEALRKIAREARGARRSRQPPRFTTASSR
ncbi:ATP-binding protein [Burkholderia mayonis]|uniref:Virulence sensor protein BvgS n=1 Tax=Burkholderia mayonis TaxID=1385591 RepID=A0A1B4G6K8_9BURK|nr:ATP-binding protein [Burkholderia mayonis]AOJ11552.1 hybrid sensor histidine kinase/response regulator [Burkholderia mayonis]KVE46525.1 hybrid sensor histidine kinase/response regulator [Burkholderia mayonis]